MLKRILPLLLTLLTACSCATVSPRLALRKRIAPKVYKLEWSSGGGTGFAIKTPSGKSYILTNAHVCDATTNSDLLGKYIEVRDGDVGLHRRIIKVSDKTDLCLMEGIGDEGLELANGFVIGESIHTVGFPELGNQSMLEGEINAVQDIEYLKYRITATKTDKDCKLPKESVQNRSFPGELSFFLPVIDKACVVTILNSISTTVFARPGSSGSPAVNDAGKVVGIVFATNGMNWANLVSLKDLQDFLKPY